MNAWLNQQIAIHNIRVSPRLPIEDRVKRFYTAYAAQQGITLDDEDADLCAILVNMRYADGIDARFAIDALYTNTATTTEVEEPSTPSGNTHHSRQIDIRKCRRSPRLNR